MYITLYRPIYLSAYIYVNRFKIALCAKHGIKSCLELSIYGGLYVQKHILYQNVITKTQQNENHTTAKPKTLSKKY